MAFNVPTLQSPANAVQGPADPFSEFLSAVSQIPQTMRTAQMAQQDAVLQRQKALQEQGDAAAQRLAQVIKLNPALAKDPGIIAQAQKIQSMRQLPLTFTQQTPDPDAGKMQPTGMKTSVPYAAAQNQPGQTPTSIPYATAQNPMAPKSAQDTQPALDVKSLQAPIDPAKALENGAVLQNLTRMQPEARRAYAEALGLNLPDALLDAPPMLDPGEKLTLRTQLGVGLQKLASGDMNFGQFSAFLSANEDAMKSLGVNVGSLLQQAPGALSQLSAQAQSQIQQREAAGILTHVQAQAMLAKLPGELQAIKTKSDLDAAHTKYFGTETALLPVKVQANIQFHQQQIAVAQGNLAQRTRDLDFKIQQAQQNGGSPKALSEMESATRIMQSDVNQLGSNYHTLLGQATKIQTTPPYDAAPQALTDQITAAKNQYDDAQAKLHSYTETIRQMKPAAYQAVGLQGVQPAAAAPVPPAVETMYKNQSKADRAKTLNDPRSTPAIRKYLLQKYGS